MLGSNDYGWTRAKAKREAALPAPTGYAACKRCGKHFQPKPTKLLVTKMTTRCETCQCKNLFDGLDMPTPPSLLDKHTKHPTLTDAEWRKKLNEDDDGYEKDCDKFNRTGNSPTHGAA